MFPRFIFQDCFPVLLWLSVSVKQQDLITSESIQFPEIQQNPFAYFLIQSSLCYVVFVVWGGQLLKGAD